MLFQVAHGDIAELSRLTGVPHETVRRYVNGGDVRVSAARKIDEAASKMGLQQQNQEAAPIEKADEKQTAPRKSAEPTQ